MDEAKEVCQEFRVVAVEQSSRCLRLWERGVTVCMYALLPVANNFVEDTKHFKLKITKQYKENKPVESCKRNCASSNI